MNTVILGLPGMYQNWLSAALDPNSEFQQQGANFITAASAVPWVTKIDIVEPPKADYVINMCVGYHNLVWYLHNFLEKTDAVGIRTNYLADDLKSLGANTKAFGDLLIHWYTNYDIKNNQDKDYINNSLIEYFYLWLVQKHAWQSMLISRLSDTHGVNLEYTAFNSLQRLRTTLDPVISDADWFDQMYERLRSANSQYLNQGEKFCTKLGLIDNINRLTILEQSYLGSLLHSIIDMGDAVVDWFNPNVRTRLWKNYRTALVDTHRMYMLQSQHL